MISLVFFRGATAYEAQIGRLWVRVTHLRGGGWAGAKLRERIGFGWERGEQ